MSLAGTETSAPARASSISRGGILAGIFTLTIITLPVLDWRWMLGLASYVRPLSLFPMLIGLGIYALTLKGDSKLPTTRAFFLFWSFFCWALVSTLLMAAISPGVGVLKGWTVESKSIREFLTLALGFMMYFYFSVMITKAEDVRRATKLIYFSFVPVAIAALIESGAIFLHLGVAQALDSVLMAFRVQNQGTDYSKIMSLAPEGSMFADQLLSLFAPFAFAAIVTKCPVFQRRIFGMSLDLLLLITSMFFLAICGSRTGLVLSLALLGSGTMIAIFFTGRTISPIRKIAIIVVPIALLGGAAATPQVRQAAAPIVASIAGVNQSIDSGIWSNITRAGNQVAAVKMFLDYPIAGVGTGGYAFHYAEYIPDWALFSPEVQAYLGIYDRRFAAACPDCQIDAILNGLLADPKGLIARIAAETGIIGLGLMGAFWFVLLRRSWRAFRAPTEPYVKGLALGCLLSLIDILFLTFNISSYVWAHWYLIYAMAAALPDPKIVRSDDAARR